MVDNMETLMSVLMGIGLSAACGFRVFVPLFIASIAAKMGCLNLAPGYEWLGSWPVIVTLGCAMGCEIVAYYVPWIDNLMDALASPAAVGAGMLVAASTMVDVPQHLKWALVLLAGGSAATTQLATVKTRMLSTAFTGGVANPIVSTIEGIGSMVMSVLAMIIPVMGLIFLTLTGIVLYRLFAGGKPPAKSEIM